MYIHITYPISNIHKLYLPSCNVLMLLKLQSKLRLALLLLNTYVIIFVTREFGVWHVIWLQIGPVEDNGLAVSNFWPPWHKHLQSIKYPCAFASMGPTLLHLHCLSIGSKLNLLTGRELILLVQYCFFVFFICDSYKCLIIDYSYKYMILISALRTHSSEYVLIGIGNKVCQINIHHMWWHY